MISAAIAVSAAVVSLTALVLNLKKWNHSPMLALIFGLFLLTILAAVAIRAYQSYEDDIRRWREKRKLVRQIKRIRKFGKKYGK